MALSAAHHVVFCSCPLALSLLLFSFTSDCLRPLATHLCTIYAIMCVVISFLLYISRALPLFALNVSVDRAFLSCYSSRPDLDCNGTEKEDCSAVLR
jgi:hypothetical protein